MSATDVKSIVCHCQCRRFVEGTPGAPCTCHECGQEHVPPEDYGSATVPVMEEYVPRNAEMEACAAMNRGWYPEMMDR
jgi:hypothetical protein